MQANLNACIRIMEPQPETATATVRVCGQDIQTTAEELKMAGVEVKDPAAFLIQFQFISISIIKGPYYPVVGNCIKGPYYPALIYVGTDVELCHSPPEGGSIGSM